MCTYLLCVPFSFEGFPLNGNFRDNNVNVYTLYCLRFEQNACLFSCRQRKRCHVDQCGAVYLNRLNQPGWKVSKETMEREYGWLANQAVGNIGVFCLTVAEKVQFGEEDQFCIWNAKLEKHPLLARHTMEK